jgi:hypothetical protein
MKQISIKKSQFWSLTVVAAIAMIWSALPIVLHVDAGEVPPILVRNAVLVSPTGGVNPHGDAEYQLYSNGNRELEVEIEDVNLPNGTVLTAFVSNSPVGTLTLSLQRGKLKLRTEDGQTVPVVDAGALVDVRNGETVLVSGTFGGGPNPSPSPSASPTGSPTGSPSPSPSASPTGSPTGSPSPSPSASPSPSPGGENEIYAILSGPTVNGILPQGYAAYEIHSSRTELEIRVSRVSLPAGTALNVTVQGTAVGNLILQSGGEGRLRLRSDRGEIVPVVVPGHTITLKSGATTVLSGTFAGNGTPTPTPTGTPQGRRFEGHLAGIPPVPPAGNNVPRGEVQMVLNATEDQVSITGEYTHLTSAQTGGQIFCDVAGNTSVIHDFGALGGTERHFTATAAISTSQVQMLRANMCSAIFNTSANPGGEIRGAIRNDSSASDFNGDGSNEVSVFRASNSTWYTGEGAGYSMQVLGQPGDKLVSGDYDGDGRTDAAVFSSGTWTIKRSSDGGLTTRQFGLAGDVPLRGDFDGDGINDIAVYRGSNGAWYVTRSSDNGISINQFGLNGDTPVPADFDGDGKTDLAVFRNSNGAWYVYRSSDNQVAALIFGQNGDTPIAGDFNGDGQAEVVIYRPTTGVWYEYDLTKNTYRINPFGTEGDIPVAADYDGDGKMDIAVFRPSNTYWFIWRSSDLNYEYRQFGISTDIPVVGR